MGWDEIWETGNWVRSLAQPSNPWPSLRSARAQMIPGARSKELGFLDGGGGDESWAADDVSWQKRHGSNLAGLGATATGSN